MSEEKSDKEKKDEYPKPDRGIQVKLYEALKKEKAEEEKDKE